MSMFKIFDVAGTGMSAQTLRLNVTASNMANADSVSSSVDKTYRARQPVFSAMLNEAAMQGDDTAVGVRVRGVVESQSPLKMRHDPTHPMADEKGNVYLPNVNVVEEMANMMSASRSYQSNVEVVNTTKQLMLRTLELGK